MLDSFYAVSVVRWLFGGGGGIVALGTPRWVGGDVCLMCLWFGVVPREELLLLEGVEAAVTAQLLLPLWLICFSRFRLCYNYFEVQREGYFNHLQPPSNRHPFPIAAALFLFRRVSFVRIVFGLRGLIVVDVVVFLVLSVIDLEFQKSIRRAHFRWGAVWAVSPRLSFRAYRQRRLFTDVVDVMMTPEIPHRLISLRVVIADPFFAEVENKAFLSLDGATELQEGISVSFGCHALRQVVILSCAGCVNSSCVSVSRIMLTSIDNIFSPSLLILLRLDT
ncbi:hypothetical protein GIB67_041501 [Kingdonia uniflora]|uniref:Uncharacterized protein n=1 Tax=Kingdonia uniflora TaxID=39325 RepID=A0A7J7MQG1_9MAGN|nr:hypothetical protein GIB67_041501 [Kingdonia uniflora]